MPETVGEVIATVVRITAKLNNPIACDLWGPKPFTNLCDITYAINGQQHTVKEGKNFDGPSIPRCFWWIVGFSPVDLETLLASNIHDDMLESGIIRMMADAWFGSVLSGATLNGRPLRKCKEWRAKLMYYAVRAWSIHAERKRKRAARKAAADNLTSPDKVP